ncbi:hypothetical protein Plec18167_009355 [Paecilomyces lecythidis]|uniref:AB hydrolase-1 domain-containing protein n=1 Tax=Paecilomyces lecythidis TaxID=3004212 RepID=A0ABR3WQG6_9EURO
MDHFLKGWFVDADLDKVKRENVKDFIRWGFFNNLPGDREAEDDVELYTREIEALQGRPFPEGKSSGLEHLGQKLEKTDGLHRSLLWYLVIFIVDAITYCSMTYKGFSFYRTDFTKFFRVFPLRPYTLFSQRKSPAPHLSYWYREHKAKDRLPVLFLHGIGVGLWPYTTFLSELAKAGKNEDTGIIALELMPISSRITNPVIKKEQMVSEIHAILKKHRWEKVVLVSHSYGSVIATHLIKSPVTAPYIGPAVFIDPVCFLLHLPDVAYNFTVRKPVHANEHQLWYFASKDMGVAHTLAKRFSWSDNILWKEDLDVEEIQGSRRKGRKVTVALSGQDLIVDTEAVGQYLQSMENAVGHDSKVSLSSAEKEDPASWKRRQWNGYGLEILWYDALDHAQVFDFRGTRLPIIKAITVYSLTG